jgi:hypothetical protein
MEQMREWEDKVFLFIGQIVTRWSKIEQNLVGQIGDLQMELRHRNLQRAKAGPQAFQEYLERDLSDFHSQSDKRLNNRLRHLGRLFGFVTNDAEALKRWDLLKKRSWELYSVRNDVAHSEVMLSFLTGTIELYNSSWTKNVEKEQEEDWKKGRFKSDPRGFNQWLADNSLIRSGRKKYSLADLQKHADDLEQLSWDFRSLITDSPRKGDDFGPVPAPSDKGKTPRLST